MRSLTKKPAKLFGLLDRRGKRILKVAIATPCTDHVDAGYAYDLVRLVATVTRERPDIQLTVHQNRGTLLPQQRATLVASAREASATHMLWIDSDMRFPTTALFDLLAHEQPIVACNYSTRRQPILPTAEHRQHGYLFTPPDANGLAEVTHCGMGLMLVDMSVYAQTPEPWFAIGFSPTDKEYSGEDFFFCKRAKENGFPTLIDQALSRQIRHAGQIEWTADHAIVTRDAYAQMETAKPEKQEAPHGA